MLIREITDVIERFAPLAWQESYDNAGLIVGRPDDEVRKALLAVDVTDEVMAEAAATLEAFGVDFEKRVVSAHRTPDLLCEYAKTAKERGIGVIIAGAGGAAGARGVLALAGISSGRLPENSMAPNGQAMPHSLQLTHRLSFSWTAPSTRVMAFTGQTPAQVASSQWWQSCGADSFSLRMTRRRGMDCSPCRR